MRTLHISARLRRRLAVAWLDSLAAATTVTTGTRETADGRCGDCGETATARAAWGHTPGCHRDVTATRGYAARRWAR